MYEAKTSKINNKQKVKRTLFLLCNFCDSASSCFGLNLLEICYLASLLNYARFESLLDYHGDVISECMYTCSDLSYNFFNGSIPESLGQL